jgi:hypothetical protein
VAVRTTELAGSLSPLQARTPLDTKLIDTCEVNRYVNSSGQARAVPFLDMGNCCIHADAQYIPQQLAGLTVTRIAGQLSGPFSPVSGRAAQQHRQLGASC